MSEGERKRRQRTLVVLAEERQNRHLEAEFGVEEESDVALVAARQVNRLQNLPMGMFSRSRRLSRKSSAPWPASLANCWR